MKVRLILLLGSDERVQQSFGNAVQHYSNPVMHGGRLVLCGKLCFDENDNMLSFQEVFKAKTQEQLSIPNKQASLEDILGEQIDDLIVLLIAHGNEQKFGSLIIKPTPWKSIQVNVEALAKFFLITGLVII